ncbi:MAG: hypothetical protein U0174_15545 [Polyangiaceae bacterium]
MASRVPHTNRRTFGERRIVGIVRLVVTVLRGKNIVRRIVYVYRSGTEALKRCDTRQT